MNITDLSIKALKPPTGAAKIYYDDTVTGFGVRVTKSGVKSYILTHGPRRIRETIGRVGIVRLQDARSAAKTLLAEYTLGKTRPRVQGWNTALKEYLSEVQEKRRDGTYKSYSRHLKKHFKFGDTRMADVSPDDLIRALEKLKDRPAELHHAYTSLRAFIRWAHRKHYLDKNPMERMQTPESSKPRARILSDAELKKVWLACPDDAFGRIVRLLILCGQRIGETSKIADTMIGKDTITFPETLTKNGREHTFPFPKMAKPYLHHLTYGGFSKGKFRLDTVSKVSGWTLHDLRRTYASKMAELGVSLPVIERLLNHVSSSFAGVVGVYQRYDFMREMKAAVSDYETWLQSLLET